MGGLDHGFWNRGTDAHPGIFHPGRGCIGASRREIVGPPLQDLRMSVRREGRITTGIPEPAAAGLRQAIILVPPVDCGLCVFFFQNQGILFRDGV